MQAERGRRHPFPAHAGTATVARLRLTAADGGPRLRRRSFGTALRDLGGR
jgi:hypothetical protein